MSPKLSIFAALSALLLPPALPAQTFHLGGPVSDFTLRDKNNATVHYSKLRGDLTVVMFFSTRCPMSNAFNYRRNQIIKDYAGRVNFIVVDPNANESLEEMQNYAHNGEFDFPVYKDPGNVVADLFSATITTDCFLIDSSGVIRYHGYLEDSPNPTRAKIKGLRIAIESLLANEQIAMPEAVALGCAIRRVT